MPNPKRQHSKQRGRKRRTHQKLGFPSSIDLTQKSTQQGFNHRVDPVTGFYKGRQVINMTPKQKKAQDQ